MRQGRSLPPILGRLPAGPTVKKSMGSRRAEGHGESVSPTPGYDVEWIEQPELRLFARRRLAVSAPLSPSAVRFVPHA